MLMRQLVFKLLEWLWVMVVESSNLRIPGRGAIPPVTFLTRSARHSPSQSCASVFQTGGARTSPSRSCTLITPVTHQPQYRAFEFPDRTMHIDLPDPAGELVHESLWPVDVGLPISPWNSKATAGVSTHQSGWIGLAPRNEDLLTYRGHTTAGDLRFKDEQRSIVFLRVKPLDDPFRSARG